ALRPTAHPVGVRPVGLDDHAVESLLGDETLGDSRPLPVQLVRSVCRFSEEDESRARRQLQQRVVVAPCSAHQARRLADGVDELRTRHWRASCSLAGPQACPAACLRPSSSASRWVSSSGSTGLTRCASNPLSSARSLSSGRPYPVRATRRMWLPPSL